MRTSLSRTPSVSDFSRCREILGGESHVGEFKKLHEGERIRRAVFEVNCFSTGQLKTATTANQEFTGTTANTVSPVFFLDTGDFPTGNDYIISPWICQFNVTITDNDGSAKNCYFDIPSRDNQTTIRLFDLNVSRCSDYALIDDSDTQVILFLQRDISAAKEEHTGRIGNDVASIPRPIF